MPPFVVIKNLYEATAMKKLFTLLILLAITMLTSEANAQKAAIKSNIFYDATATANIGIEIKLAPKWTFDLSGNLNGWRLSGDKQWRHWLAQPEARYWFCNTFAGHFVGTHLLGGQYNFGHLNMGFRLPGSDLSKLKDFRYQGWFVGAGITYGYAWILSRRWTLETEIGLGWAYTRYDRFRCAGCGRKIESNQTHNYFGPTKVAINLVYAF